MNNLPWRRLLRNAARLTLLGALAGSLVAQAPAEGEADPADRSRFARLAAALQHAPSTEQSAFIAIALTEMAIAYSVEADIARSQATQEPTLWNWARSVDRYSAGLVDLANGIDAATPLRVDLLADQQVQLLVAGKVILISAPRLQQEAAIEYLIVEQFCSRYPCERLLAGFAATAASLPSNDLGPNWNFSDQSGPSCATSSGLALKFSDTRRLSEKRALCQQLTEELERLLAEVSRQRSQGVAVDWSRLAVAGTVPGQGQRIQLNRAGDSVLVAAPLLAAHPGLLRQLRPWLQARTGSRQFAMTVRDAETLLPAADAPTGTVLMLPGDAR